MGFPTSGPTLLNSDTGDVGSFSVSTSFHIEITSLNTHPVPLSQKKTFQGKFDDNLLASLGALFI